MRPRQQGSQDLTPPVVEARHQGDADRGKRNLNDQLDPVNAGCRGNACGGGDCRTYQSGDDPHQECEPERDILPAWCHHAAQDTE